jgi:hypothetical protein
MVRVRARGIETSGSSRGERKMGLSALGIGDYLGSSVDPDPLNNEGASKSVFNSGKRRELLGLRDTTKAYINRVQNTKISLGLLDG